MTAIVESFHYIGGELELFAEARNWKIYLQRMIRPYIGAQVLEVGAGIGGTTSFLCTGDENQWVCLEPDAELCHQVADRILKAELPANCRTICGTTADVDERSFDTILYIDVLEHIEDDAAELRQAAGLLRPGGKIVVLSPAHPFLFSPFDEAVGHYRRYNKTMIRAVSPPRTDLSRLVYLDSVGLIASLGNRLLLKQSQPTRRQIDLWDRCMVPVSGWLDPVLARRLGKSILGVWTLAD